MINRKKLDQFVKEFQICVVHKYHDNAYDPMYFGKSTGEAKNAMTRSPKSVVFKDGIDKTKEFKNI